MLFGHGVDVFAPADHDQNGKVEFGLGKTLALAAPVIGFHRTSSVILCPRDLQPLRFQ